MRRSLLAVPVALLLSLVVAGTAFATHCGNESKQAGAGQHQTILANPVTGAFIFLEGGNAAGKFRGAFLDVYLDFDVSGDVSSGDGFIDDTYIISQHSGRPRRARTTGALRSSRASSAARIRPAPARASGSPRSRSFRNRPPASAGTIEPMSASGLRARRRSRHVSGNSPT